MGQNEMCLYLTRASGLQQNTLMRWLLLTGNKQLQSHRCALLRRQLCILHEDKGKRFNRCGVHAACLLMRLLATLPSGARCPVFNA